MQFAKVAHATDFLYCYSIIESNRRSDYAPESQQGTATKSRPVIHPAIVGSSMHAELNTFFPFDPYKLPKSSTYIQDVYREWASVAIDDDDEEDVSLVNQSVYFLTQCFQDEQDDPQEDGQPVDGKPEEKPKIGQVAPLRQRGNKSVNGVRCLENATELQAGQLCYDG